VPFFVGDATSRDERDLKTEMATETAHLPYKESEIWRAAHLFLKDGDVIELRALGVKGGGTSSGYFDDREAFVEAAMELSGRAEGVYCTLNPVQPELIARAKNRVRQFARTTTIDEEVDRRRFLFIDLDPVRPRGMSATTGELRKAIVRADEIQKWMVNEWPDRTPYIAISGNGVHMLYKCNMPNTPENRDFQQVVLKVLADRFTDKYVEVDQATFNASRIIRLYGTLACKGDHTEDRPHRISRIIVDPNQE